MPAAPRENLWIDDSDPPPSGWRRVADPSETIRLLRAHRVAAVALGQPAERAMAVAQGLEQGAFTGSVPRVRVELRLPPGVERDLVGSSVEAAVRHWGSVPTRPLAQRPPRAKRGPLAVFARFLFWHLVGFAIAVAVVEGWYRWKHGTDAPIVSSLAGAVRSVFRR